MKSCRICKAEKNEEDFHKDKSKKGGRMSVCKECDTIRSREKGYMRIYGISKEVYYEMYKHQNGKCLICGEPKDILCVDHDHKTKKVRGLLCRSCNYDLGKYENNPNLMDGFIRYIQQNL